MSVRLPLVWILPLALAAAFVLSACSSSGSGTTPTSATPTRSRTAATKAPPKPSRTATPSGPSLDEKIGQMLMAGFDGTTLTDDARGLIRDEHIGNVILMGRNVTSPAQVLALTQQLQQAAIEANGVGLLIATDQEGGSVQRLKDGFTRLPDAVTVGNAQRPDLTQTLGHIAGDEMRAVGVNLDFAPDLDVNDNPANPVIGPRAFGSTADVVRLQGPTFAAGLHDGGVMAVGKHFPGHGNTSANSHFELPVVNKTLAQLHAVELPPFRTAIDSGIDGLMIAHVAYPALDASGLPATVSKPIVTDLLRGELGFKGVIFTDDMGMKGISELMSPEEAAVRAVAAGADVLLCIRADTGDGSSCLPSYFERMRSALLTAVRDGQLSEERIDESYERVMALKAKYNVGPASGEGLDQVGSAAHGQVVDEIENLAK